MIRLVIIEDEPLAAERLEKLLKKTTLEFKLLAILESVSQAKKWFAENPAPDLVLSDIQLGDGISFQIFENQTIASPIIFTTSYDEYAIRAFKVQSIDYLLKPVKQEDLEQALEKFNKQMPAQPFIWSSFQQALGQAMEQLKPANGDYKERFLVKQADQLIPVTTKEIAYFFTRNDWVCLSTHEGKQYLVDFTLDEVLDTLNPKSFFRLNRQFIASAQAIQKAHNHLNGKLKIELQPLPPEEVFVSREKAGIFRSWWEG